jgi:hypothetical protein
MLSLYGLNGELRNCALDWRGPQLAAVYHLVVVDHFQSMKAFLQDMKSALLNN